MKTKIIPFDLETAKKIQAGEIKGRIVTRDGLSVRSICYDAENSYPLVCLVRNEDGDEEVYSYKENGGYHTDICDLDLFIELPEEAPITFHVDIPKGHVEIHGDSISFVNDEIPKLNDITTREGFHRIFQKHEFKKGDFVEIIDGDEKGMIGTICTGNVVQLNGVLCYYVDMCDGNDGTVAVPIQYIVKREDLCDTTKSNEFKPFDKVLVRQCDYCTSDDYEEATWLASLYSNKCICDTHKIITGKIFKQCIPYEGNEHLVGTTDKPKEE